MILYGLKTCDTCKKALKALEAAGTPVEFIDLRAGVDLVAKVPTWLEAAGPGLLNKTSTTWRNLADSEKARAEADLAGLLMAYPTLIKRPVIEAEGKVHVGWKKDVQSALLQG